MKNKLMLNARGLLAITIVACALLAAGGCAPKVADGTYVTPEEAVAALIAAFEQGDTAALTTVLGPGAEDIVSSGDAVADKTDRATFVAAYKAKNSLVAEGEGMTLVIGDNDWPMPVPLVQRDGRWAWDGAAGADEIVYRRVGANELGAIDVCRGFVQAQFDYAAAGHDGDPPGIYALKLLSDAGMQNGLYWPTAEGEAPSPAGPFVASAAGEGYRRSTDRMPYHGYYYRLLYAQGTNANGGARDYFKDGLMTEGFALVAWPAEYGASGVQTFIVNHDGVVFQKDLGEDTVNVVETIKLFDPDSSWTALVPPQVDAAAPAGPVPPAEAAPAS